MSEEEIAAFEATKNEDEWNALCDHLKRSTVDIQQIGG